MIDFSAMSNIIEASTKAEPIPQAKPVAVEQPTVESTSNTEDAMRAKIQAMPISSILRYIECAESQEAVLKLCNYLSNEQKEALGMATESVEIAVAIEDEEEINAETEFDDNIEELEEPEEEFGDLEDDEFEEEEIIEGEDEDFYEEEIIDDDFIEEETILDEDDEFEEEETILDEDELDDSEGTIEPEAEQSAINREVISGLTPSEQPDDDDEYAEEEEIIVDDAYSDEDELYSDEDEEELFEDEYIEDEDEEEIFVDDAYSDEDEEEIFEDEYIEDEDEFQDEAEGTVVEATAPLFVATPTPAPVEEPIISAPAEDDALDEEEIFEDDTYSDEDEYFEEEEIIISDEDEYFEEEEIIEDEEEEIIEEEELTEELDEVEDTQEEQLISDCGVSSALDTFEADETFAKGTPEPAFAEPEWEDDADFDIAPAIQEPLIPDIDTGAQNSVSEPTPSESVAPPKAKPKPATQPKAKPVAPVAKPRPQAPVVEDDVDLSEFMGNIKGLGTPTPKPKATPKAVQKPIQKTVAPATKQDISRTKPEIMHENGVLYEPGWSILTYLTKNKANKEAKHIDTVRKFYSEKTIRSGEMSGMFIIHKGYLRK